MKQLREHKRKYRIVFLFAFFVMFAFSFEEAKADGPLQTGLYSDGLDTITNMIEIYGMHHFTDGENLWTYRTVAFNIATAPCKDITNPPPGVKKMRIDLAQNKSILWLENWKGKTWEYSRSSYGMHASDFSNAIQELYKNEIQEAGKRGESVYKATLYLNNIFQVGFRQKKVIDGERKHGEPMHSLYSLVSEEEYETAEALAANRYYRGWSKDNFAGFYNYPYEYDIYLVEAKINYIDKQGRLLQESVKKQYGLRNGVDSYQLDDMQLDIDGKSYSFLGQASEDYKDGRGASLVSSPNGYLVYRYNQNGIIINYLFEEKENSPTPEPKVQEEEKDVVLGTSQTLNNPMINANILAETKGSEKYRTEEGIPTQEALYISSKLTDFLISYQLTNISGTKTYPVTVSKTYILKWTNLVPTLDGEPLKIPMTEVVPLTNTIYVTRNYDYWVVDEFHLYLPQSMTVNNYALPGESVTIKANPSMLNKPTLRLHRYEGEAAHLSDPKEYLQGICLSDEIIEGGNQKPAIPYYEFQMLSGSVANSQTESIKVRNDSLFFDSDYVLSDQWTSQTTDIHLEILQKRQPKAKEGIFEEHNLIIEATKNNGSFLSNGTVVYLLDKESTRGEASKSFSLQNKINQVCLHTPVLCNPIMECDNESFVQAISSDGTKIPLVIDEEGKSSDFILLISNFGTHRNLLGYENRDFSTILRENETKLSNIEKTKEGKLRNEVRFPFDLFLDVGNDYEESNDVFVAKNSWVVLGSQKQRFYLPLFTEEGSYSFECRTVAVNANGREEKTQKDKNTNWDTYVATNIVEVEVMGRMYGLTIRDINDYPLWQEVFRATDGTLKSNLSSQYPLGVIGAGTNPLFASNDDKKSFAYNYTVGTKNQYGEETGRNQKFTFPLLTESHPFYDRTELPKMGYVVGFSLHTTGKLYDKACKVLVTPSFYWVDKAGKNREEVNLYYSATIEGTYHSLIRAKSSVDLRNTTTIRCGDPMLGIPESELLQTALLQGEDSFLRSYSKDKLCFGSAMTLIGERFRTFSGIDYAKKMLSSKNATQILAAGVTKETMIKARQSWYGQICIPRNAKVASTKVDVEKIAKTKGIMGVEDFWKKDGYLIVNLDLVVYDENQKAHLSYDNRGHGASKCNMWALEGANLNKTSQGLPSMQLQYGDFLIFAVGKSASGDYEIEGVY